MHLNLLDSISRSHLTPKGTRPSLLCDNFLEFLYNKKWHLTHSTHNLISHEIEQSNGDIEEQRLCKQAKKNKEIIEKGRPQQTKDYDQQIRALESF